MLSDREEAELVRFKVGWNFLKLFHHGLFGKHRFTDVDDGFDEVVRKHPGIRRAAKKPAQAPSHHQERHKNRTSGACE